MSEHEILVFDDEDFHHTIHMVKARNRQYAFYIVSEKKDDPSAARFFKTLKMNGQTATPASDEPKTNIEDQNLDEPEPEIEDSDFDDPETEFENPTLDEPRPEIPIKLPPSVLPEYFKFEPDRKSGRRVMGTGTGRGTGNKGKKEERVLSEPTPQSRPLRIIYKPSPAYTDLARFYEINGVVKVQVTFLADGTVGSVVPLTKLPFGLTRSAVTAARQFRFEPQLVDGKPVTVARQIFFSFSVY